MRYFRWRYSRDPSELPRLRSGFRLRAQTPARRLNFDARTTHGIEFLLLSSRAIAGFSGERLHAVFQMEIFSGSFGAPSTALGISPAGSNARKTAQLRRAHNAWN